MSSPEGTPTNAPQGASWPGQAEVPAAPGSETAVGSRIGPYRLVQGIGEGGFGLVFIAEQDHPVKRTVALKVIRPGMDTAAVIARFEAERQALALMSHPGVARVYDAGTTPLGRPYFVMEYVPGEPITDYCDRNRLSTRERLELFIKVCDAVQHAHQKGIIHRDLKPSNVLVTLVEREGRSEPLPKVIDFGIAKAVEQPLTDRTLVTLQGMVLGTPEYMSPEQAMGSGLDVDTRTDVYSLGVLLYELLTGTLPLDPGRLRKAALYEVQRMIREEEPPRPSERLSGLSRASMRTATGELTAASVAQSRRTDAPSLARLLRGDLDWIAMRAMDKERARRYDTPSALAADIRRHLTHEPVEAGPPSAAYRMIKFARRNVGFIAAVAAVVIALSIGLAFATSNYYKAQNERAKADAARATATAAARKAEAVNDFLLEMLGSADPTVTGRPDMSVREAIDIAAKKVDEGSLKSEPEVEAAVRATLGVTYGRIGDYDNAEKELRQAVSIRKTLHGADHPETLIAMNDLAVMLGDAGRDIESEQLYRETLERRIKVFGEMNADVASSMNNLATALGELGKRDEALRLTRRALEIQEKLLGPDSVDVATSLTNLAQLELRRAPKNDADKAHNDQAVAYARRALEIRQKAFGEDNPQTLQTLNNYAGMLFETGKTAEAEQLFRQVLEGRVRTLGADHPDVGRLWNNLGGVMYNTERPKEAEEYARKALDIYRKSLGPSAPDTIKTSVNVARIISNAGRHAEAEQLLLEAQSAARAIERIDPYRRMSVLQELVDLYKAWNKPDEAKRWQDEIDAHEKAAAEEQKP